MMPDANCAPCLRVQMPCAPDVCSSKRIILLGLPCILVLEDVAELLIAFIEQVQVKSQNLVGQPDGQNSDY